MLDMQQAAEHVLFLAERHGLKEVDALIEREDALEVEIREGKVEKVEQSTSLGLGVRVLRDGKTGLASTERLDADAIERAFQSALENSELQDPTEVLLPEAANGFSPPESLEIYNSNLENLTSKDLAELGLVIEGAAKNADTRVSTIPYLGVSRNSSELLLVNTKGTRYHQRSNSVGAYCGALLQDGDVRKTGMR
ncbi:MAG: TldD/PmbA family protein, partial [SAR324 cluster bacterium]|nr:TldD/PmbA family protein [SAR324 cluster bacterium]